MTLKCMFLMSCGTSWEDPGSPLYIEGQLGSGEALALAIMWTPMKAHLTNWLLRLGSYKDIFFHENEGSEPVCPFEKKTLSVFIAQDEI